MSFLQELEKIMAGYRLSGEGYTDEEMRVLKRMCKSMLADIDEFSAEKGGKEEGRTEREEKEERKEIRNKMWKDIKRKSPGYLYTCIINGYCKSVLYIGQVYNFNF